MTSYDPTAHNSPFIRPGSERLCIVPVLHGDGMDIERMSQLDGVAEGLTDVLVITSDDTALVLDLLSDPAPAWLLIHPIDGDDDVVIDTDANDDGDTDGDPEVLNAIFQGVMETGLVALRDERENIPGDAELAHRLNTFVVSGHYREGVVIQRWYEDKEDGAIRPLATPPFTIATTRSR